MLGLAPEPLGIQVKDGNASGISFSSGGNVAGGTGTELNTYNQIPVMVIIPLRGGK